MRQKKRDANAVQEWIHPRQIIIATAPRRVRPWWRRWWWHAQAHLPWCVQRLYIRHRLHALEQLNAKIMQRSRW